MFPSRTPSPSSHITPPSGQKRGRTSPRQIRHRSPQLSISTPVKEGDELVTIDDSLRHLVSMIRTSLENKGDQNESIFEQSSLIETSVEHIGQEDRDSRNRAAFAYFCPMHALDNTREYDPYDIVPVSTSEINTKDYFTASYKGLTHFHHGQVKFKKKKMYRENCF